MPAEHPSEAAAIVATLRAVGMTLRLDGGEPDISGKPKAPAVWQALDAAIEGLGELVAETLREEANAAGGIRDTPAGSLLPPERKERRPADPLDRWQSIGLALTR
jgi:hypothetical protein